MYIKIIILSYCLLVINAEQANKANAYKDQFCTDPRTMRKHAAYTEWADAYSCTRHRCQPGGRNLAIYTVGCKRVEAPESAIECEEVVEDTNMQFPYCCTRLRCLVVVRGEVWTRVLGQPWETLPAAPWSHMYKMKKPPPGNGGFIPKAIGEGPVYELAADPLPSHDHEGLKSRKASHSAKDVSDAEEPTPRASVPSPDIVIALTTTNDNPKEKKVAAAESQKSSRPAKPQYMDDVEELEKLESEIEEPRSNHPISQKDTQPQPGWTDIPQQQWAEPDPPLRGQESLEDKIEKPEADQEKPSFNLQALVDAIGTRMRDIEDVVQKMSDKVHQGKKDRQIIDYNSGESFKRSSEITNSRINKPEKAVKPKKLSPEPDHYKRFSVRNRGSKYLRANDISTESPVFEEGNVRGYFSDASNSVLRRSGPKEPMQPTYMAPIETRRKDSTPQEDDKKKRHKHKKRHSKANHLHKKNRRKDYKQKKAKRPSSETETNIVSLEDSAPVGQ